MTTSCHSHDVMGLMMIDMTCSLGFSFVRSLDFCKRDLLPEDRWDLAADLMSEINVRLGGFFFPLGTVVRSYLLGDQSGFT
jgi:hypothetical protein